MSDMVFSLLFLLASLWSLHLLPPLSSAVNPILGSWALPSPSVQCPSNSLGFLNSSLTNGVFLANLHPNLPIFPPCLLTLSFNLSFLLLLNFLLVLLFFPWLVLYSLPSEHSYFLICTDSPAASFVPLESFIPCMCVPSSRSSVRYGGSLASDTNPWLTEAGIQPVRT